MTVDLKRIRGKTLAFTFILAALLACINEKPQNSVERFVYGFVLRSFVCKVQNWSTITDNREDTFSVILDGMQYIAVHTYIPFSIFRGIFMHLSMYFWCR